MGCTLWLGLMILAALIIAGILLWKILSASLSTADKGMDFLKSLPEKFQSHHITETFLSTITQITPTNGDILEVAVVERDESVSRFDMKTLFNDLIYLGSTVSEIRVPVVYRYHIRISDDWQLSTRGNVVTVIAPVIRPSLPPAIRTDRMEKRTESDWLRFNVKENLAALEKSLTPTFEARADNPGHINSARDASRKAVARFVQQWLLRERQWRPDGFNTIVVVFADEPAARDAGEMTKEPATITLP
jgi:hypothetical protein